MWNRARAKVRGDREPCRTNKQGRRGAVCVSSGWGSTDRIDRLVLVGRLIGISLDDANSFRRDALPFFCSFILVAAPVQLKTTQHQCARASASSLQQMRAFPAYELRAREDQGTASEVRARPRRRAPTLAHFWRHFGSIVRALTMRSFALTCLYFAPTARCVVAQYVLADPPQGAPRKSLLPS